MCGICGVVAFGAEREGTETRVLAMREAMYERGPDDAGLERLGPAVFGHRRLAVIDLTAAGHQPMRADDGSVLLVFNGEIYNFAELRRELEAQGESFRSRSDTEVILRGYLAWGIGALCRRMLGMWAFAIWDAREQVLLLARDRLGKKPLYYARRDGEVAFASSLRALMRLGGDWDMDLDALDAYLAFGYVPTDRAILAGVDKVPAGGWVRVSASGERTDRYWRIDLRPRRDMDATEARHETRERLRLAVSRRLVADVPLGAFLSGGVDSSLVLACMAEGLRRVQAFTMVVPGSDYDESAHARRVAEHLGVELHEVEIPEVSGADLPFLVEQYGEPYADSSALPALWVARAARSQVTVALTGDGGDEAFGGYGYVPYARRLERWRRRSPRRACGALASILPAGGRSALERIENLLWHINVDFYRTYERRARLHGARRAAWYAGTRMMSRLDHPVHAPVLRALEGFEAADDVGRSLGIDYATVLGGDYLVKIDVAFMAVSLEGRCPFLDHELVEFAASIPPEIRLPGGEAKGLLKSVARELLPAEVIDRRKQGFTIPVREWLKGSWSAVLDHFVEHSRAVDLGLLNRDGIRDTVAEHRRGRIHHENLLWAFLCLELWLRQVFEGTETAAAARDRLEELARP